MHINNIELTKLRFTCYDKTKRVRCMCIAKLLSVTVLYIDHALSEIYKEETTNLNNFQFKAIVICLIETRVYDKL